MKSELRIIVVRSLLAACLALGAGTPGAQAPAKPYEPMVGQEGKDVVWVPTADVMVEKMLDVARVTPDDFVIGLGSVEGRTVIAAAKRGARSLGVEYNPDLVEYAKRRAAAAGVPGRALFVQGDMYAADISSASVLALFLLSENLSKLLPKFLELRPGSRIVTNTYEIPGWTADASETVREDSCTSFCTVFLYVVPAKVAGAWRMPEGDLTLKQDFQRITGTFSVGGASVPIENGRLNSSEIRFSVNGVEYAGRIDGDTMEGIAKDKGASTAWRGTRAIAGAGSDTKG